MQTLSGPDRTGPDPSDGAAAAAVASTGRIGELTTSWRKKRSPAGRTFCGQVYSPSRTVVFFFMKKALVSDTTAICARSQSISSVAGAIDMLVDVREQHHRRMNI